MADVPDGWGWSDIRPGEFFLSLAGESSLRHRAFSQRSAAALQGSRQGVGPAGISRWRIFDRRHRHLSLGLAPRGSSSQTGRVSQREALVRCAFGAARGATGNGGAEGIKSPASGVRRPGSGENTGHQTLDTGPGVAICIISLLDCVLFSIETKKFRKESFYG